jgi:hypothetical protein
MKDQKSYKKQLADTCEPGCKGTIVNKAKGQYCSCIESQMPNRKLKSKKEFYTNRIDDFWIQDDFYNREVSETDVVDQLVEFGLDPHEVELLVLRYIENKSMIEIVKLQGWLKLESANYYLRKTLAKLRAGSFKLK